MELRKEKGSEHRMGDDAPFTTTTDIDYLASDGSIKVLVSQLPKGHAICVLPPGANLSLPPTNQA